MSTTTRWSFLESQNLLKSEICTTTTPIDTPKNVMIKKAGGVGKEGSCVMREFSELCNTGELCDNY